MRVPQPIIPFRAPTQPVQVLRSGRGGKIEVTYIRCLNGPVPETYELWDIAEEGVREVQPSARVRLLENFREDIFTPTYSMHDDSRFLSWVADP